MSEEGFSPQISTNVRVHRLVRTVFWWAQRAGTPIAAALLERFFLTPRRAQLSADEMAFLSNGQLEFLDGETGRIATWCFGEGRTVLLVHGWGSSAARYRALIAALLNHGYRVLALDAPAHGASSGRRSSLPETAAAIGRVVERERERRGAWPFAVVAHSFGAAAAILAQRDGAFFERSVWLAPAIDFDGYLDRVVAALGISNSVRQRMIRRVERRLGFNWEQIAIDRVAVQLTAPALIFHDPADAEVPFNDARRLQRAWLGSSLVATPALGHRRLLHDASVVDQIIRFIRFSTPARDQLDLRGEPESTLQVRPRPRARPGL